MRKEPHTVADTALIRIAAALERPSAPISDAAVRGSEFRARQATKREAELLAKPTLSPEERDELRLTVGQYTFAELEAWVRSAVTAPDPADTSAEVARLAAKGLRDPLSLSPDEIRVVCGSALGQRE